MLLEGLDVVGTGSNIEATRGAMPPGIGLGSDAGATVWWSWVAPTTGVFSVSSEGSSFGPMINVYAGASLANLDWVAGASWDWWQQRTLLAFSAEAGTPYRLVDGQQDYAGQIRFRIAPFTPPANDPFADAFRLIGAGVTTNGSTFGASAEPGEPALPGFGNLQHSIWWIWSPPADDTYEIAVKGSNSSPQVVLFTGESISNLTTLGSGRTVVVGAKAGTEYRLAVDQPYDSGGDIQLSIQPVLRPPNDDFADRVGLSGSAVELTGSITYATAEPGEPPHNQTGHYPETASVWWSWVAPSAGSYLLEASSTEVSSWVAVYEGGVLTDLRMVSTSPSEYDQPDSQAVFEAVGGNGYQLVVASPLGSTGSFTLRLQPFQRPSNDQFANRTVLSEAWVEVEGSALGASIEPGEPMGSSCPMPASVWWTWIAPSNGFFTLGLSEYSSYDPVSVFVGTELSDLCGRLARSQVWPRLPPKSARSITSRSGTVRDRLLTSRSRSVPSNPQPMMISRIDCFWPALLLRRRVRTSMPQLSRPNRSTGLTPTSILSGGRGRLRLVERRPLAQACRR